MARYLAIDWDHQQLCVVEGTADMGKAKVRQARLWSEPLPADAEAAGRRLKERLREGGFAPAPVLFSVAREKVIFRDIRYPDVPPEEVASIVRFQAMKEIQLPADEVAIDYATTDASWPTGEKRALAVALQSDQLTAIQKICQTAGLKLESVTPRPFGILANFFSRLPGHSANEAVAILVAINGGGELCICRGHELLFSRTLSRTEGASSPLTGLLPDVRRSLAAYESQFAKQPVTAMFVAADGEDFYPAEWESLLHVPVKPYEPAEKALRGLPASGRGPLAAPIGLIQAKSRSTALPVDFLAPKQPPPPDTRKRRYSIIAAAAVVLFALAGGAMYTMASMAKDEELRLLQDQVAGLNKQIAAYGDLETRIDAVNKWDSAEVVVLDELYDLIARFPDLTGIHISEVRWESMATETKPVLGRTQPSPNGKPAAKGTVKPVSKLTIIAASESASALEQLRRALDGERHWKVDQWLIDTPGKGQLTATFKVFPQEPQEYQVVLGPTQNVTASSGGQRDRSRDRTQGRRFQPPGRSP